MPRDPRCWLLKSEPEEYSIAQLQRDRRTLWTGVRNYQARNFLRDRMAAGDEVLFYHSNADPSGIAGLARVVAPARPDPTAWDRSSPYFDARSTAEAPVWFGVEVGFVAAFPRVIPLDELRGVPELAGLLVLRRGQRLSVQPVERAHFERILRLAR